MNSGSDLPTGYIDNKARDEPYPPADEPARTSARAPHLAPLILLIASLALLAMGRSCGHRFTNWDDEINLVRNPDFNPPSAGSVLNYWRRPFAHMYMPMAYTVWGLLAHVAYSPTTGLNPHVFHAFNVLLHAANAGLVFLLVRRLLGNSRNSTWAAAAGAALFAVHPIQVETVNWVTGMKDLLWGFFALLALIGYVVSAQRACAGAPATRWSRWGPYALGTFALTLALLSKPTAVVTPILALLIDRLMIRRSWTAVFRTVAPWVLIAIPMIIVAVVVHPAPNVTPPPLWQRPLVAADALAFYLGKIVYPSNLTIDHGRNPALVIGRGWAYFTWLAPAGLALVLWLARRRLPAASAGGALAVAGVLPLLGLVPFDLQAISTVADRYAYVPMFGIALIVAGCLATVPLRWWAAPVSVLIVVLGVLSVAQSRHWHDGVALNRHAIRVNPNSAGGHLNLAGALLDKGATAAALPLARRAVELNPRKSGAHWTVAACLWNQGMLPEAEEAFRQAMKLDPESSTATVSLAEFLAQQGRLDEAVSLARRAAELEPDDPVTRFIVGNILFQAGQLDDAERELTIAARSMRDPRAHSTLGIVLARLGRPEEARRHLRDALTLDPANAAAREELERLDKSSLLPVDR